MPSVGIEPTISAGERPQTYALDRAATGTGDSALWWFNIAGQNTVIPRLTSDPANEFFG